MSPEEPRKKDGGWSRCLGSHGRLGNVESCLSAVPHTSHQEALLPCSGREPGVGSLWGAGRESGREGSVTDISKLGVTLAEALSGHKYPNE